ncbi:mechanosensitive channel MscK [Haemophilus parahaemolyticus]|uniref:mechanosensitive channel MscK n=1 Tax=Haemophilus parahaemolyticus TaxID=735 RepID=UPI0024905FC2|nr:mechanosensitive channel MscK [Haemophilus parahaemolyticus]
MFKNTASILFSCLFSLTLFSHEVWAEVSQNRAEESLRQQISALRSGSLESAEMNAQDQNLELTKHFNEQTLKQKADFAVLEKQLQALPQDLAQVQKRTIENKKEVDAVSENSFNSLSLADLIKQQERIEADLQSVQSQLLALDAQISNDRNLLKNNQRLLNENSVRLQEINRVKSLPPQSHLLNEMERWDAEIRFIEESNRYNNLLSNNAERLIAFDEAKRSEAAARQALMQKQLSVLQEVLNTKRLEDSEQKAKDVASQRIASSIENFLITDELDHNKELSQFLVQQTKKLNTLSHDDLRMRNVLESLTQTQRNIDEQISALQGTLVLSKVINKQKQTLPTEKINNNLAKSISNVRVNLFEYSQQRDELYNIDDYVRNLTHNLEEPLTNEENSALNNILKERQKLLDEIIKSLNSQLNLSITIENNQRQALAIGDALQRKLQQQSFWVNSNNPIDFAWLKAFPALAFAEVGVLTDYVGIENVQPNLLSTVLFTSISLLIALLINWKKSAIKDRLASLASRVNTLTNDSHWLTPEAMFWTILLALPSTLIFFTAYNAIGFLFFNDPIAIGRWGVRVTLYWWFFATMLSLLRPNGLAFRHFGMPQESNRIFQRIIKQSIWIVGLLLVSSIPSQIDEIGYLNDAIGQVMSIIALALCLFVVRPLLNRAIREYQKAKKEEGTTNTSISLFRLLRLILVIVPISLIILIILGYYYTAVYLITHLLNSYFVILLWVFGRYFAYRFVAISARRLAYRRLQDKRRKLREQVLENGTKEDETIKLSVVNQQIYRVTDLIGWVVLFVSLYVIWSDLISVAYYLDGVILWESNEGNQVESVTLLNLMRASLYVIITYVLIKNITGILEVTVFSKIPLSKGTPQTIITMLTYVIVTFGSVSAFSALGISWTKIQWIFTALSVGLGFGVREIFGSFVSGSILLFERPIRVGDKVTVGQYTGIITKIRLRSTTLLNSDHMEVVLPNQAFVTDRFINWTLNNTITRLQIFFKVSYDTDLDLMQRLLLQAVNEAPKVLSEPKVEINMLHFGDNALEHELLVFVGELGDRIETMNFLQYRINQLFRENGIRFALNQLDVHLHSEDNLAAQAGKIA